MNRKEFMEGLERLLGDLAEEERQSALEYYNDYFEDAGVEYEQEVIKELGSPEHVANTIKAELGMISVDVKYEQSQTKTEETEKKAKDSVNRNTGMIVVIVLLLIATSPIWIGVGGGILGILLGAAGVIVGLCVALAAICAGMLIGGAASVVAGIAVLFVHPGTGLLAIGIGCILFMIGLLCLLLCIKFYGTFLPWLFQSIGNLFQRLIHGRRERT
jgi:uncharacterized membrane protein